MQVEGARGVPVTAEVLLQYEEGWDWEAAKSYLEKAMQDYLLSLRKSWAESQGGLTVRVSALESALLACPGVVDVTVTRSTARAKTFPFRRTRCRWEEC